jgi:hypothetical protein
MHFFLFGYEIFMNHGNGSSGIWYDSDGKDFTLNIGKFEAIVSLHRRRPFWWIVPIGVY